jgi:pimeloyl-ACP methyl ester carboxylesterase
LEIKSSADFVRMTRGALAAAGFMRREVGGTVYFESAVGSRQSAVEPEGDASAAADRRLPTADSYVFVHGANDQAGTWCMVAPAVARTHRVILLDLPGHGESAPETGPLPISLLVDRLEAVIDDAAPGERVTLVGNSLGGWITLLYALAHPERITRIVLESSGGLARPLSSPLTASTREEAFPILRAVHGPNYTPQEWVIDALLERASGSPMLRLTEVLEHDIEPRLGEIQMPAMLIWGADDGVLPLSYGEALRDAIPNAVLHVIDGAAHIPHMQQPERFLQCLTATS